MGTKSQKISAAVLALAVVAFAVDRWVIGDAGDPSAAPVPERVVRTPQPVPVATQAAPSQPHTAPATPRPSLASRLAAMSESRRVSAEAVADAFRPSDVWVAIVAPPPPLPKAEPARPPASRVAPKIDRAALFAQRHTLTAVMKDGDGGMAIVNGKLYRVGQYVGGFKLTRVGLSDASFWGKGVGAKLKLAGHFPATADAR